MPQIVHAGRHFRTEKGGSRLTAQFILLVWLALGLGVKLAYHGQPRTGKYNFYVSFLRVAIEIFILYVGGFFS